MWLFDMLFGTKFQRVVKRFCSAHGWKLADIKRDFAALQFRTNSARLQGCYLSCHENTIEFVVPSFVRYDHLDDIPHRLSTLLLKRSRQRKIGYWCLLELNGQEVFSCMHNAEMNLIDSDYFGRIVKALVEECDEFERIATNG